MAETQPTYEDEIDLIEFFQIFYDGKWKILTTMAICVLGVLGFKFTQPNPTFEATTNIMPITAEEAEGYRTSNSFGFFEITPQILNDLFILQLKERTIFEDAIRKHELVDVKNFKTENEFNDAVSLFASRIEVIPAELNAENKRNVNIENEFWTINGKYNDRKKWKLFLSNVSDLANQKVKYILLQRFDNLIEVAKQERQFQIENINT